MTTQEFQDLFVEISSTVADEFYPKGDPRRGEYLRDQGVLHVRLSAALTEQGVLKQG